MAILAAQFEDCAAAEQKSRLNGPVRSAKVCDGEVRGELAIWSPLSIGPFVWRMATERRLQGRS